MTFEQFEEIIMNSPLKICMSVIYATPRSWGARMGQKYDNLKVHHRHKGYGCLLGIYGYHIHKELIRDDEHTNDAFIPLWDEFQKDLGIKFNRIDENPFNITYWPEIKRVSYLSTQDDKERKQIALDVLRTFIDEAKDNQT